jgi:hypothetical protein
MILYLFYCQINSVRPLVSIRELKLPVKWKKGLLCIWVLLFVVNTFIHEFWLSFEWLPEILCAVVSYKTKYITVNYSFLPSTAVLLMKLKFVDFQVCMDRFYNFGAAIFTNLNWTWFMCHNSVILLVLQWYYQFCSSVNLLQSIF